MVGGRKVVMSCGQLTSPEMARDASSATGEPSHPARPYSTWGDRQRGWEVGV